MSEETRPDLDDWQLDESWEVVATVGTDEEATVLAGYLRANGIPAQVESLRFHQEPVNFAAMGEVRVRVPQEYRQESLRLISDRETHGLSAEADEAERATEGLPPETVGPGGEGGQEP